MGTFSTVVSLCNQKIFANFRVNRDKAQMKTRFDWIKSMKCYFRMTLRRVHTLLSFRM